MKKILSILLSLAMLTATTLTFTACDSKKDNEETSLSSNEITVSPNEKIVIDGVMELTFESTWFSMIGFNNSPQFTVRGTVTNLSDKEIHIDTITRGLGSKFIFDDTKESEYFIAAVEDGTKLEAYVIPAHKTKSVVFYCIEDDEFFESLECKKVELILNLVNTPDHLEGFYSDRLRGRGDEAEKYVEENDVPYNSYHITFSEESESAAKNIKELYPNAITAKPNEKIVIDDVMELTLESAEFDVEYENSPYYFTVKGTVTNLSDKTFDIAEMTRVLGSKFIFDDTKESRNMRIYVSDDSMLSGTKSVYFYCIEDDSFFESLDCKKVDMILNLANTPDHLEGFDNTISEVKEYIKENNVTYNTYHITFDF